MRVYSNMKGLEKVYKDSNILPRSECFGEFIRGFNMGDPMCDYVDAGNGKECSDEKVKGESHPMIPHGRGLLASRFRF